MPEDRKPNYKETLSPNWKDTLSPADRESANRIVARVVDEVEADRMKVLPKSDLTEQCVNTKTMQSNPEYPTELQKVGPKVAEVCTKAGVAMKANP